MPFCTNCGEKVEDDQKVCMHCGKSLEKSDDKSKSEDAFYVPIDFSDVKEVIPIGEDIIYSSLFSVYTHGMSGPFHERSQTFQSHVLFTKKGIAYQEPKAGLMKSSYIPWYKVTQLSVAIFGLRGGTKMYVFTMKQHPDYESDKDFEMRTWKFLFEFVPHVINEKKKKKATKGLKKFEKTYNTIKKVLGEEECEFFRTNSDYEEFKKHHPLLRNAMSEASPKWAQFIAKKIITK